MKVFAPARVNLIGEHTDYSGGLVLPVAIDLGTEVSWRPLDGLVRMRSLDRDAVVEIPLRGSADGIEGWGRYVAAVVDLLAERGRPAAGIDATVASTVPIGAGLSSSAALTVSTALALCRAASFEIEPLELAHLAQAAELEAVGVPCGLMDPATSLIARRSHALLLDCSTEAYRHVPLPPELAIVIVDSGVRHTLEQSGYAQRRTELERALAGGDADATAVRRLRHVTSENERVRECAVALEAAGGPDLRALGTLFRASHESLRDDFEVSTPELDLLVDLAYGHGAVAARMTGGGFGGSIVALADAGRAAAIGSAICASYAERTGRRAAAWVCTSVDGAARP
jgi:galactokinase